MVFQRNVMALPCRGLTRERALVHPEVKTVDHCAIGRHFLSSLKNDDIAYYNVTAWHLSDVIVAHDLDHHMVIGLIK